MLLVLQGQFLEIHTQLHSGQTGRTSRATRLAGGTSFRLTCRRGILQLRAFFECLKSENETSSNCFMLNDTTFMISLQVHFGIMYKDGLLILCMMVMTLFTYLEKMFNETENSVKIYSNTECFGNKAALIYFFFFFFNLKDNDIPYYVVIISIIMKFKLFYTNSFLV